MTPAFLTRIFLLLERLVVAQERQAAALEHIAMIRRPQPHGDEVRG